MQPSGGRSRDDVAREKLPPLREGERPTAVTVAASVALAIGIGNLVTFAAGVREVGGTQVTLAGVLPPSVLLLIVALGMWRARYWAVLAFQAFLAIAIVLVSLTLLSRTDFLAVVLLLLALAGSLALFWTLVKAMARIQARPP